MQGITGLPVSENFRLPSLKLLTQGKKYKTQFKILQGIVEGHYISVLLDNQVFILRHIRPCISEKIAIKFSSELMENVIVKKGGSIKGLMFSEEFMALVSYIFFPGLFFIFFIIFAH